jgi:hypothetical protein
MHYYTFTSYHHHTAAKQQSHTVFDKDIKGLSVFKEKYKSKTGIVITKTYLDKKDDMIYIPFWMIR